MPGGRPALYVGCTVEDCARRHYSRGYCRMHYKRVQREGRPGEAVTRKHLGNPEGKWCAYCREMKPLNEFYKVSTGKRPRYSAYCKEHDLQRSREQRQAKRLAVLEEMGGKCVRCGFDDDRALQIDHVKGGGTAEHQLMGTTAAFYSKVLANPDDYQLLCANCNWIKKVENNEVRKFSAS